MTLPPFTPDNIVEDNGRWYLGDQDITGMLIDWTCELGHEWRASLAARAGSGDLGCPICYAIAHPLAYPLDGTPAPSNDAAIATFKNTIKSGYASLPVDELTTAERIAVAKSAYTDLLEFLTELNAIVALTAMDEDGPMTVLHSQFAVGTADL